MTIEAYKTFLDFAEIARGHEEAVHRQHTLWQVIETCEILFGALNLGWDARPVRRGWVQREERIIITHAREKRRLERVINSVPNIGEIFDHATFYARGQQVVGIVVQPYGQSLPADGQSPWGSWRRLDSQSWWFPPRTGLLLIQPADVLQTTGGPQ